MSAGIKAKLDSDCSLVIEVSAEVKKALLDSYMDMIKQFSQATKWMDDKTTDPKTKAQYRPVYDNMLKSISFYYNILKAAGVSREELTKITNEAQL